MRRNGYGGRTFLPVTRTALRPVPAPAAFCRAKIEWNRPAACHSHHGESGKLDLFWPYSSRIYLQAARRMNRTLIVMPTYNERENLPLMAQRLLDLPVSVDLLVVDDNSPDGTGRIADELAAKHPE